jgi:hypothetical protein
MPAIVSSAALPGESRSVVINGDIAYVGQGGYGSSWLQVVDVSDPLAPLWVGGTYLIQLSDTAAAVGGSYLFVATHFGLLVLPVQCTGALEWTDVTAGPLGDPGLGEGVAWGDYDGDGDHDLYLSNQGPNRLFRNEGNDVFVDATIGPLGDPGLGRGIVWGDYDDDGDLDLDLTNRGSSNKLVRNDGGGSFSDVTQGPLGDPGDTHGVAWGDADNDGDIDLYIANFNSANKLLRNDGDGAFTAVTAGPLGDPGRGFGGGFGDCDLDGDLDLYLVNDLENRLLRNDGDLVFTDVTAGGPLADDGNGRGADWGATTPMATRTTCWETCSDSLRAPHRCSATTATSSLRTSLPPRSAKRATGPASSGATATTTGTSTSTSPAWTVRTGFS